MMNILEEKGYLKKRAEDKAHVYRPAQAKAKVIRAHGAGVCRSASSTAPRSPFWCNWSRTGSFRRKIWTKSPARSRRRNERPALVPEPDCLQPASCAGGLPPDSFCLACCGCGRRASFMATGRRCWRCACCFRSSSPGATSRWRGAQRQPAASCSTRTWRSTAAGNALHSPG